jgi:type II secretory pathway pseudopilin PulG
MSCSLGVPSPDLDVRLSGRPERKIHNCLSAFTIVEAVISTIIVAVMFVAALNTVGASRLTQYKASLVSRGRLLAESLMSEILRQNYEEPDGATDLGLDPGELATTRVDYDDVDDYHGWSATPPTARDGTVLANSTGWQQAVVVRWVDPSQPDQVVATESGAKRITVTISYNGVPQASITALRTAHE